MQPMEYGVHTFSYSVFPFTDTASAERTATVLNGGVRRVMGSFHSGKLPQEYRGFASDCDNLIITALKKHEDGNATVLRCFDMQGVDTTAHFTVLDSNFTVTVPRLGLATADTDGRTLSAQEWEVQS
jgi:alpha-mannosidase